MIPIDQGVASMLFMLWKKYELSLLKDSIALRVVDRSSVPILCIDDEGLEYEEILRTHDFNIKVLKDIEDIKAVKEYPIVICDIQGVGKSFGSKYQGAHIIEEIKKQYPHKIVIANTGQKHDVRYNKYFIMADYTIPKDIDSDQWVENLDNAIKKVASPVEQWKRMRDFLFENDVTTRQVYLLEMDYVKSILSKNQKTLLESQVLASINSNAKAVMQGFAASFIFKLVVG